VRVIDEEGNQLGIMPTMEALRTARDRGLDLVEVQPMANPPVCRIMDHGRHKYEQEMRARESKRQSSSRATELKEVQLSPVIAEHDLGIRVGHAQRFLDEGSKVRLTVRFRGIHMRHPELGHQVLQKALDALKDYGTLDGQPSMVGRIMSAMVVPTRARAAAAAQRRIRPDQPEGAPQPPAAPPTEEAQPTAPPDVAAAPPAPAGPAPATRA
jgi:translation initiation factor IF-3